MAVFPFSVNILSHIALAIVFACLLIILTIGLNMVYSVLKFSNFAHAEFVTLGMYIAWWSLQVLTFAMPWDADHWINNLFLQASIAFFIVGTLGVLGEILVFRRLRNVKASATSLTVASIGLGLIFRNFLSMIFGDKPSPNLNLCSHCTNSAFLPGFIPDFLRQQLFHFQLFDSTVWGVQSIRITVFEFYIIIMAFIFVFGVDYLFRRTKTGIAMRATSDSFELAQVSGINTKRIVYITWFLAAGITGFGGAFLRANLPKFTSLDGFFLLLPIFAVVILGGVGSFRGGIIAAFIIAFAKQFSVVILTEAQKPGGFWLEQLGRPDDSIESIIGIITLAPSYSEAIGFVVLILVLLFRPQGISGSIDATRARV